MLGALIQSGLLAALQTCICCLCYIALHQVKVEHLCAVCVSFIPSFIFCLCPPFWLSPDMAALEESTICNSSTAIHERTNLAHELNSSIAGG